LVQEANTTFAVYEQVHGDNMFDAGDIVQEEISGPVPGENTTEASTFAIDDQVYGEDLSGVAEVPAYLLPGNDVPEDFAGPVPGNTTEASTFAIDDQVYGEDLSGVAEVPAYLLPGNDVPEDFAGPMSGNNQGLGDWAQCSSNSQCSNGCCSDAAVAGVFSCIPLSGDFDPSICTAV
jgi:hypothetical protein